VLARRSCLFCEGQFSAVRLGHIYCSSTCRKLSHKAKKRAELEKRLNARLEIKLKRLVGTPFGKYLSNELKRAGTAQVLTGHTADSLKALAALRRRCTTAGGYEEGAPIGTYELSHIYPVSCKKRLGLLHPSNLVICPKEYNRKHSKKVPKTGYLGASLERSELKKKWSISETLTSLEVIEIARKFLGSEFNKWLKSHLISHSQYKQLLKRLTEEGVPESVLKGMTLEELKALAAEEEVPFFNKNISSTDLLWVIQDELDRLLPESELVQIVSSLNEFWNSFDDPKHEFLGSDSEKAEFETFVITQSLNALHGQSYEVVWKGNAFSAYFRKAERSSAWVREYDSGDILF
jgi:hypothetical protein